ncbi:hypothetical protein BDW60DRAFT_204626 [Aspergillus nidulans var. acristatus]
MSLTTGDLTRSPRTIKDPTFFIVIKLLPQHSYRRILPFTSNLTASAASKVESHTTRRNIQNHPNLAYQTSDRPLTLPILRRPRNTTLTTRTAVNMSEPGPSSIPTSADPRSHRPTKRRAVSPHSEQASVINSLFRDPSKEIKLPTATTKRTASSLPAPPEIVANVQGSSAGAGSGEFHVYKASRRREYERLRLMQEEVDREKEGAEWQRKQEEVRKKDQEKTEKNRRRREKRNKAKAKGAKKGAGAGADAGGAAEGGKGSDEMDVTEEKGVTTNKTGEEDQTEAAVETPGVIIHDDE